MRPQRRKMFDTLNKGCYKPLDLVVGCKAKGSSNSPAFGNLGIRNA